MKRAPAALMAAFASALALLAAQPAAAAPEPASGPARDLLEGEVVYHIFQRSLRDSNGDGPNLISGERKPLRPWQTALYRPAR